MNQAHEFAVAVFKAVDAMDAEGFAQFLTRDAEFVFGNGEPIKGREAIATYVGGFFSSIAGIRHEILDVLTSGEALVVRQCVTYTRKDNRQVHLPCANILRMKDGLICDYRIYMDIAPVFA